MIRKTTDNDAAGKQMEPTKSAAIGWAATGLAVVLAAAPAWARTPYILPNTFNPERAQVTLQGATTEDDYFNPDGALNAPDYLSTLPSGQQTRIVPAARLRDMVVTEAALQEAGTYRFSTGQMVTRTADFANVAGRWLPIREPRGPRPAIPTFVPEAEVPAGAARMKSDSVMVVETYVSKGAPTEAALKTSGQGFELKPVNHPNAVYVDQGFAFQLLADGQPAAGAAIAVYRSGNIYDDRRIAAEQKSDAKGMTKIAFAQPGVYLLTARYPVGPRAPGEAPPAKTYTYSLTFEVTR